MIEEEHAVASHHYHQETKFSDETKQIEIIYKL